MVPDGRLMIGVPDFTGTLRENQVFVQYSDFRDPDDKSLRVVHRGKLVVAKNPCLWPGDVRVQEAVDVPQFRDTHCDVIVFSTRGDRPVPNMCSRSDLDGDLYSVFWVPDIVAGIRKEFEPLDYTPPKPKQAVTPSWTLPELLAHQIANQLVLTLQNSRDVGKIADDHFALADAHGAAAEECKELALEFSKAVDYPKTGVAAKSYKAVTSKPDFMEKLGTSYESKRILGKLYRLAAAILPDAESFGQLAERRESFSDAATTMVAELFVTPESELMWSRVLESVSKLKYAYDTEIRGMIYNYGIASEAELFAGCFANKKNLKLDGYKLRIQLKIQLRQLQQRYRNEFFERIIIAVSGQPSKLGVTAEDAVKQDEKLLKLAKAAASSYLELDDDSRRRKQLYSFRWIVVGDLVLTEPKCVFS
jgi:RNA-dependent RNA polymerase